MHFIVSKFFRRRALLDTRSHLVLLGSSVCNWRPLLFFYGFFFFILNRFFRRQQKTQLLFYYFFFNFLIVLRSFVSSRLPYYYSVVSLCLTYAQANQVQSPCGKFFPSVYCAYIYYFIFNMMDYIIFRFNFVKKSLYLSSLEMFKWIKI